MIRIEILPQAEWILEELRKRGYEAFVVGGCVRDALLGRVPGDWDITTSALPEEIKQVFGRTVDTGIQHGTVTVIRDRAGYEVTTYRIDGEYEDGRHPKQVAFTRSLREDLLRRDFTINAMAYSHETGLVDMFGGLADLKAGRIRCVGDPRQRFTEDALRILRAVRFSAQLDFAIEEGTREALAEFAPCLSRISRERIQAELTKTLLSDHPQRMELVRETGMAPFVSETFPAAFRGAETSRFLEASRALPAGKAVRWAAFLAPAGERDAVRILRELKLDNETIRTAGTLVSRVRDELPRGEGELRRLMSGLDDDTLELLLRLRAALFPEDAARAEETRRAAAGVRARGECTALRDLAVSGTDLLAAGFPPGPGLGRILNGLLQAVLEDPGRNKKETLLLLAGELSGCEKETG